MNKSNLEDWDQCLPDSPNGHMIPNTLYSEDKLETISINSDITLDIPVKNAPHIVGKQNITQETSKKSSTSKHRFANLFKTRYTINSEDLDINDTDPIDDIIIDNNNGSDLSKLSQTKLYNDINAYINKLIDAIYSSFSDIIYNWVINKPKVSSTFLTFNLNEVLNSFYSYEELDRIQLKDLYYGNIVLEFVPTGSNNNFPVISINELINNIVKDMKHIGYNISVYQNLNDDRCNYVFSYDTPHQRPLKPSPLSGEVSYYQAPVQYKEVVQYKPVVKHRNTIKSTSYVYYEDCYKHPNCMIQSNEIQRHHPDGFGGYEKRTTVERDHIKKYNSREKLRLSTIFEDLQKKSTVNRSRRKPVLSTIFG
jgi:hypothetical protein